MIKTLFFFSLFACLLAGPTFGQQILKLHEGTKTSIRGLSVVNDSVAWVSGSNGYTALSVDGGEDWSWTQIQGYEKFDFRDIEGFSAKEAVIVSAGTPAVILLTADGGKTWKKVYENKAPEIFLDGMAFWNRKKGLIYGDPIGGKMQLLQTQDGGRSWTDISDQLAVPLENGEAGFAASGTGVRILRGGKVFIATGGSRSRLFFSPDFGRTWKVSEIPILQGKSSTGPFSIAFRDQRTGAAVGGDYLADTLRKKNFVRTTDGGRNWTGPVVAPWGYRSAIEYISAEQLIATGPTGTDISADGGKSWKPLPGGGFHCVRKAKKGSLILFSGSEGRIGKLIL